MAREAEKTGRGLRPAGAPAGSAVFLSDRSEGPDLLGVQLAIRPLVELCLAASAETPFSVGLVGSRGAGKSFALRRLREGVESLARSAARTTAPAFLTKPLIATIDAASAGGDPASAMASAVFAALEREQDGAAYAQLADEAAHSAIDPRRAASVAAERHDETIRRLEQERQARDEVEAKRARVPEAMLYDTPGSRIDAFVRGSRGRIERRLRAFGFAEGDAGASFRSLVRDLTDLSPGARFGVFLRAIFGYRGQLGLIGLAVLAFAVAFALHWLRAPSGDQPLSGLSAQFAPAFDWVKAHDEPIEFATEALIVLGFAALFANLGRAVGFSTVLFRGARLLQLDIRERRRELDASAARLERRVAALQVEADADSQRADALARRVGSGAPSTRPSGPPFLKPVEAPARAVREFMRELSRLMGAGAPPAPQRILIFIDNVDLAPPAEARRFLEAATSLAGPGMAVIVACDPSRLSDDPRPYAESLFQVVFDVGAISEVEGAALAAQLLAPAATTPVPLGEPAADKSRLAEPLTEDESRLLTSASGLIGANPRALKRYFNAYRLARFSEASRPLLAVCLAALMAPDPSPAQALRWALFSSDGTLPSGPPALSAALEAAGLKVIDKAAGLAAWNVARRYAPWRD